MTILGENAKASITGIDFVVDGDIELGLDRDVIEHKLRGKAVVEKIPSKHLAISGELVGSPVNGVWEDVLAPFLGADKLDTTTDLSAVNIKGATEPSDITIEFDWADNGAHVRLTGVIIAGVTTSAPKDDVEQITISFHANGIEKV